MRWRQALLAAALSTGGAVALYTLRDAGLTLAVAVALLVYVGVRVLIGTYYRSRYWYRRSGRNTRECRRCGRQISRRAGDLVTKCYHRINQHPHGPKPEQECGWKPGWPGTRLVTRSVVARQVIRSITWQRLGVIGLAGALLLTPISISAGGALAGSSGTSAASADGASTPVATEPPTATATTESTPTRTPAVGDEYPGTPDLESSEAETLSRINRIRQQRELPPLEQTDDLSEMAQYHVNDQARTGYYSHTAPDGESVGDRFDRFAPQCSGGAENSHKGEISHSYRIYGSQEVVSTLTVSGMSQYLVQGWMNSDGHRENMLDPQWSKAGIGIAVTPDGTFYATINFC
ncbi:CAP domain-containing protein [Haloplanus rallus]|uniref:CAP domain-containing protein n=1 Tax=Haloplanus rallus TaxID=1816183 RepID=A0A6B9F6C2_9EURY|nr:CAP domain-containing protein [Haloplanus rallus]QGX95938.1 CAP domain-containing protein [Haloplanus rallus]